MFYVMSYVHKQGDNTGTGLNNGTGTIGRFAVRHPAIYRKTSSAQQNVDGLQVRDKKRTPSLAAQYNNGLVL
jgi:hypothetical protein